MSHSITMVGTMGAYIAFLDTSKEDALELYREHHGFSPEDWIVLEKKKVMVETFYFEKYFGVYDAWIKERWSE